MRVYSMSDRLRTTFLPALALLVFSAAHAQGNSAPPASTSAPYALRHGDALYVSVWKEEALQREVRVLPDGSITFPLAGRIEVAGLSSSDAEKRVAEKLKTYLPDPVVSVVVTAIEGSRVYVIGKVPRPGPILLGSPDTTVLQALSQAGGLDKFADSNAIRVLREGTEGTEVISVNYDKLIKGENLKSNVRLKAGDTILVP
jgi:polysaccharide biosynthesis/export protein